MSLLWARAVLFGALILSPSALLAQSNASPAVEQSEQVLIPNGDGSFRHLLSEFVFPTSIAQLQSYAEHVFAPADVSVRYGASGPEDGEPWLDLFIYPATGTLDEEATGVADLIIKNYGASSLPQRPLPASASDGRSGWYRGEIGGQAIVTAFVLVRRGEWSMKVRATSPESAGTAGVEALVEAIDRIGWDWTPTRAPPRQPQAVAAR